MKLSKKRLSIASLLLVTLFWASCKKELANQPPIEKEPELQNIQNTRASGVVEDDPVRVSMVPLIMSSDLMKKAFNEPALIAALRGGKPIKSSDITPPTVSITSPTNVPTVSGNISITVNATDNVGGVGVSSVNLSVDNIVTGTSSSSSPFTLSWNSAAVGNGLHTLKVTAKDAAGNTSSFSNSIQVTSSNIAGGDITSPTVSIIYPAINDVVYGTVFIRVDAYDNIRVSSVKFTVDGTIVGSSTSWPFFSFSWNSSTTASGIHTLTATATDAAGNSSSNSIQIVVNTTILPDGLLPSSVELVMPPVGDQYGEASCSSFATGYAARSAEQFYTTHASSYSATTNIFSPEFLYDQTKVGVDCGSGAGLTSDLDYMMSTGICAWQSMPYEPDNGCSLIPTPMQLSEAAKFKIASYSKIVISDITAIKTMVANKHPVIIIINVDHQFDTARVGFIWKSHVGLWGLSHAIAICGYDDAKHAYKIMNSWGTTWGDKGYTWIDYDFLPQPGSYYCYVMKV